MKIIKNIFEHKIGEYVDTGLITQRSHPNYPLWIFNYTPKAMYNNIWDEVTMQCRGLITNFAGNVIARPFKKFFNIDQETPFPFSLDQPYSMSKKMDGSLGILYQWEGKFAIATRGSFESDQAIFATELLNTKYKTVIDNYFRYNLGWTFLFEIIYPENKIVVNYGDLKEIVHIGLVEILTGVQRGPSKIPGMESAEKVSLQFSDIFGTDSETEEGFVATFADGNNIKFKFPTYLMRAKIMNNLTNKNILLACSQGKQNDLLGICPDELYPELKQKINNFFYQFSVFENDAKICVERIKEKFSTRKEQAQHIIKNVPTASIRALLFLALDEKDMTEYIWKMLDY